MSENLNEWLTADEMCELLGISMRTLARRAKSGKIERQGVTTAARYLLTDAKNGSSGARSAATDAKNGSSGANNPLIPQIIATTQSGTIARPFDVDAINAAWKLQNEDLGAFQELREALKGHIKLKDWEGALKKYEREKRAEKTRKRIAELADQNVPHFWRADQAEVAEKLCDMFVQKSGEPPAYEFSMLQAYTSNKGIWQEVSDARLSVTIQNWAGNAMVGEPEDAKTFRCDQVKTAIEFAKARPIMWGQGEGWLADAPKGIGFTDCFLRAAIEKGRWEMKVLPKSAENRARFGFSFPIKKRPESPRFDRFIEQLFEGAEDAMEREWLVQEQIAASLFGVAPSFNRALILYGPGGCGKSTLLNIISAAFPEGSVSAIQPQNWSEGPSLAQLANARVNIVSEMSVGDLRDINAVKAVISGDTVQAEPKYKNPFSFRPDAGHIFTANENRLPSVSDADPPFWDRWHIVPFENKFRDTDAEDRTISKSIIDEELPGVLAWIIEGAKRLFEQGKYTRCPSGDAVFVEWTNTSNNVALFYDECTTRLEIIDVKSTLPLITDIYEDYKTWTKITSHRACSRSTFGERTKSLGLHVHSGGKRARCHLKTSFQDELDSREQKARGFYK